MIKRIAVFMCILMVSMCLCVALNAAENVLLWENIDDVYGGNLVFSGRAGNYYIEIYGQSGVEMITATVTLYFKNSSGVWVEMPMDWSYSVESDELIIDEDFTGVSGRQYKAVLDATVTKAGYDEPLTKTSIVTCP